MIKSSLQIVCFKICSVENEYISLVGGRKKRMLMSVLDFMSIITLLIYTIVCDKLQFTYNNWKICSEFHGDILSFYN